MVKHFSQKLSFREKVGYSLGDSGANFVFQVLMAYQFFFFTQVMGISAFAAGTLFLVGRLFDAVTDPLMGIISDRTRHRWGRFRPWLLWSALPFAGIFWMTFTTPDFGPTGRLIYAYITYLLLMAVYTVNNVPYCALNGVMTGDINERTSISTHRFVAVTLTTFIVQGLTWPLVAKFGQGDNARGWSLTIGIFAAITVVLFVISFLAVRERVQPDPTQQSSPAQDLSDAFSNKPWLVLFFATMMIFIMLVLRGGAMMFYLNECVNRDALFAFLKELHFVTPVDGIMSGWQTALHIFGLLIEPNRSNIPNVAYAFFGMAGTLFTIGGVLLSKPLSQRFGKRETFCGCLTLVAAMTMWLLFIPADGILQLLLQSVAWGICWGPTIPLLWSMIGDSADYSEWKTGRRATGFTFGGMVFALKCGLGLGGFMSGVILTLYGYTANSPASPIAILGIRHAVSIYPAMFVAGAVVILLFYPISHGLNYQIADELAARRRARTQ